MSATKLIFVSILGCLITSSVIASPTIEAAKAYKQQVLSEQENTKKITSAVQAENEALRAMIDSLEKAVAQVKSWNGRTKGVIHASCPHVLELLAQLGAGQVNQADVRNRMLTAVAGDLEHDFSIILRNADTPVDVPGKSVLQPVILAEEREWSDLTEAMEFAIEYMKERRIRLNNNALIH